jgi:hypothetical protein
VDGLIAFSDGVHNYGDLVTFFAEVESGTNVTYEWILCDGSREYGSQITHTFQREENATYCATVYASNSVSNSSYTVYASFYELSNRTKFLPDNLLLYCDNTTIVISSATFEEFTIKTGDVLVSQDCNGGIAIVTNYEVS